MNTHEQQTAEGMLFTDQYQLTMAQRMKDTRS